MCWEHMARVLTYLSGQSEGVFKAHCSVADFWPLHTLPIINDRVWGSMQVIISSVKDYQDYDWCSVLAVVLASECADMRDKVFAIQGLLPERLCFY